MALDLSDTARLSEKLGADQDDNMQSNESFPLTVSPSTRIDQADTASGKKHLVLSVGLEVTSSRPPTGAGCREQGRSHVWLPIQKTRSNPTPRAGRLGSASSKKIRV